MSDWRKVDERQIRDGWAAVIGRRFRDGRLTDVGPGYRALDALNLL